MTATETARRSSREHSNTLHIERDVRGAGDVRYDGFRFDVGIVGLGYVGLPTAIAFRAAGSVVLGIDVSDERISAIRAGTVDLLPKDAERLRESLRTPEEFMLRSHSAELRQAAGIIVCVPTPVDEHLVPDLTLLRSACESIVANAVPGQTIVLTSTTYVGCTRDFLVTPLEQRGFTVGRDVFVAFSAERIDPGNATVDQEEIPRVLGGATAECERRAESLLLRYAARVHPVGSLETAEMTKLMENTFRAVNIALANEFADICGELEIPVNDVIDAAATKPYGFMAFRPGPGVGGHCIPCDPHYLLWQLKKARVTAPLIEQAMGEIASRPGRVANQVRERLAERGIPVDRARVLVVGVSYKPNVADLRESPALEIMSNLLAAGAEVGYLDEHFASVRLADGRRVNGCTDPGSFGADIVVLHTRHDGTDVDWLSGDELVFDTSYRAPERAKDGGQA